VVCVESEIKMSRSGYPAVIKCAADMGLHVDMTAQSFSSFAMKLVDTGNVWEAAT